MRKLQINIFDTDLVWYGMVEEVQSLILRSSWHEIQNSELHVSKFAQGVDEMLVGRILVVNGEWDKAQLIEDRTTTLQEKVWTLTLVPLKGIMQWRVVDPTMSATAWTAKPQSQIMMELVSQQVVTTTNTNRLFPHFAVNATKTLGNSIDYKAEWADLLGDTLVTLAKQSDIPIGWNVYIDYANTKFNFDTYQTTDRSINQTVNNPVVFSEDYGNIKDATYFDSIKEWMNVAYMKWNDGTNDQVTRVDYDAVQVPTGFNRRELLMDSSQKTSTAVSAEARSEMNKRPPVTTFQAEVIDNPNTMTQYGVDWFLGDVVTIQSNELGVSIDVQVTQVEEVYELGQYQLIPTFGEPKLTFIQLIKNAIKSRKG